MRNDGLGILVGCNLRLQPAQHCKTINLIDDLKFRVSSDNCLKIFSRAEISRLRSWN
jgi:hypothetical protein